MYTPVVGFRFSFSRFEGYGGDKNSYIALLRQSGYSFVVLPEGFAVHNPHEPSNARKHWEDSTVQVEMRGLTEQFFVDLKEKYGSSSKPILPICPNLKLSKKRKKMALRRKKYELPL